MVNKQVTRNVLNVSDLNINAPEFIPVKVDNHDMCNLEVIVNGMLDELLN